MVGKVVVLFRVQDFEHGTRRVAPEVACHLVDFVKQNHGVHALCTAQSMDKTARHRTDVSTAVTADFGFVTYATKRNADKVTLHGFRNGFHERRLAHARRPHKAKNRSTAFRTGQLQHGHVFHDAFFNFVQTKMLGVEFRLHLFHVEDGVRINSIRKRQEPIHVIAAHRIFRGSRLHHAHAANFVFELFFNSLAKLFRLDFLEQLVGFRRTTVIAVQFVLELANLFRNKPFLLLLGHLLAHVLLHTD